MMSGQGLAHSCYSYNPTAATNGKVWLHPSTIEAREGVGEGCND